MNQRYNITQNRPGANSVKASNYLFILGLFLFIACSGQKNSAKISDDHDLVLKRTSRQLIYPGANDGSMTHFENWTFLIEGPAMDPDSIALTYEGTRHVGKAMKAAAIQLGGDRKEETWVLKIKMPDEAARKNNDPELDESIILYEDSKAFSLPIDSVIVLEDVYYPSISN